MANGTNIYILLHEWEGSTGEYSVQGWQYRSRYREKLNRYSKIFGSGTRNVSNQIVAFWGYLFRV